MAGKILIVDDVAANRIVLKVKLIAACYQTIQAVDGASARRLARAERPDLILLNLTLPDIDGPALCRQLRRDGATRHIPLICITATTDAATRCRALAAGADEVFDKPVDEAILLARLRSLLRAHETVDELRQRAAGLCGPGMAEPAASFGDPAPRDTAHPGAGQSGAGRDRPDGGGGRADPGPGIREIAGPDPTGSMPSRPCHSPAAAPGHIALITRRPETALKWRAEIAGRLDDRLTLLTRTEALSDLAGGQAPDVFVIAVDPLAPAEGLHLISDLRSRAATRHAAICLVLPDASRDLWAMGLDLGADDIVPAPFDGAELALRLATLLRRKRLADRLRASVRDGLRLASTDALTGLHNRRHALPGLARIAERAARTGRSFAVMVLDLDRFKTVNDTWGHAAGDRVLIAVAQRLRKTLRGIDLLARIGGEEFLVVLPDTTTPEAVAERLRCVVEQRPVRLDRPAGTAVSVTLSIGLLLCDPATCADLEVTRLIDLADHALLAAKADGRNQVTVERIAA